ncbi:MAG: TraR/DksA C4-type zinc finger protein, partial [Pseudomonadota bacterium]
MQIQQMALEASRRRQLQLNKIEITLKRMETDDYGYCFDCDEEIDVRRLLIDPTNTHCIQCADK